MSRQQFDFRKFIIRQDRSAMKVSTDSVILGAWADLPREGRLLDLGCGTGLLSLIAAQKRSGLCIDAVEIDRPSAQQAQENITASPWKERIQVIPSGIQAWQGKSYDAIISNPPFFAGYKASPNHARSKARFGLGMMPDELAAQIARLLKPDGSAFLVLPREDRWLSAFQLAELSIREALLVSPYPGKPPKRMYLHLCRGLLKAPVMTELPLKTRVGGPYSAWLPDLTQEYYLPQAYQGSFPEG